MDYDPENEWWKYTCLAYEIARNKCENKAIVAFTGLLDPVTVVAQLRGNCPTEFIKTFFSKNRG